MARTVLEEVEDRCWLVADDGHECRGRGHFRPQLVCGSTPVETPFEGGGARLECDTLGVYFVLCREIGPQHGSSVEILISQSRLSPFIKFVHESFTEFRVI